MKVNNGLITGGKGEGGNDSLIIGGKVRLNDNTITGEKGEGKQRSYCRWGLGGGGRGVTNLLLVMYRCWSSELL